MKLKPKIETTGPDLRIRFLSFQKGKNVKVIKKKNQDKKISIRIPFQMFEQLQKLDLNVSAMIRAYLEVLIETEKHSLKKRDETNE